MFSEKRNLQAKARELNKDQAYKSLEDIQYLFVRPMATGWLDEIYAPFDFTNITGYSNDMRGISLDTLPLFNVDNAITAQDHLISFKGFIREKNIIHEEIV